MDINSSYAFMGKMPTSQNQKKHEFTNHAIEKVTTTKYTYKYKGNCLLLI